MLLLQAQYTYSTSTVTKHCNGTNFAIVIIIVSATWSGICFASSGAVHTRTHTHTTTTTITTSVPLQGNPIQKHMYSAPLRSAHKLLSQDRPSAQHRTAIDVVWTTNKSGWHKVQVGGIHNNIIRVVNGCINVYRESLHYIIHLSDKSTWYSKSVKGRNGSFNDLCRDHMKVSSDFVFQQGSHKVQNKLPCLLTKSLERYTTTIVQVTIINNYLEYSKSTCTQTNFGQRH